MAAAPYAVCIVGDSRTVCAIDDARLAEILSKKLERPVSVFNLAMAGSNLGEIYFGIRYLISRRKTFKNVLVVVQAANDCPSVIDWKGNWLGMTPLISKLLSQRDIVDMWLLSPESLDDRVLSQLPIDKKLMLTFASNFEAVRYFERFRKFAFALPGKAFPVAEASTSANNVEIPGMANLANAGFRVREVVTREVESIRDKPSLELETSVLPDLVSLVQRNGGSLCTYVPPRHSAAIKLLNFPWYTTKRLEFINFSERHHISNIEEISGFTDNDLPDQSHLAKLKQSAFTDKFAVRIEGICRKEFSAPP
ncbi:MAG: hypothetical protein K2W95_11860 [Candidatus Obscuribacterales bacterium]|nr:hypothetical protein [Candidatus Obscuribacterales bacterium]